MKRWRAENVAGSPPDLERALQKIEDTGRATIMGVTVAVLGGTMTLWTVYWYEHVEREEALR